MIMFYTLDENDNPVPCPDDDGYNGMLHFARWLGRNPYQAESVSKSIAKDELADGRMVSTIFLGLSLKDPPVLWETLVELSDDDYLVTRFETKEEALEYHNRMVKKYGTQ